MSRYHQSVLLKEIIDFLEVEPDCLYIDATVGGGGHAFEIIKRGGKVLGIDQDAAALDYLSKKHIKGLVLARSNFSHLYEIASKFGFTDVCGVFFDLGVSSYQLETRERGFSFQKEGPLDMRMDLQTGVTAGDLVNNLDKRRLNEVLKTYGQEKLSWAIASAVYSARQIKPIASTSELSRVVSEVYRRHKVRGKLHPATKTFLALRVVVNSELLNLKEALPQAVDLLKIGGRLAIISFHSLEDGIVKRFFKRELRLRVLTKKPIGPGSLEIAKNPRARSARLRVAEKI